MTIAMSAVMSMRMVVMVVTMMVMVMTWPCTLLRL